MRSIGACLPRLAEISIVILVMAAFPIGSPVPASAQVIDVSLEEFWIRDLDNRLFVLTETSSGSRKIYKVDPKLELIINVEPFSAGTPVVIQLLDEDDEIVPLKGRRNKPVRFWRREIEKENDVYAVEWSRARPDFSKEREMRVWFRVALADSVDAEEEDLAGTDYITLVLKQVSR